MEELQSHALQKSDAAEPPTPSALPFQTWDKGCPLGTEACDRQCLPIKTMQPLNIMLPNEAMPPVRSGMESNAPIFVSTISIEQ